MPLLCESRKMGTMTKKMAKPAKGATAAAEETVPAFSTAPPRCAPLAAPHGLTRPRGPSTLGPGLYWVVSSARGGWRSRRKTSMGTGPRWRRHGPCCEHSACRDKLARHDSAGLRPHVKGGDVSARAVSGLQVVDELRAVAWTTERDSRRRRGGSTGGGG